MRYASRRRAANEEARGQARVEAIRVPGDGLPALGILT